MGLKIAISGKGGVGKTTMVGFNRKYTNTKL
jgi:CO dehydrogenase nickel-insertion accessory protein CooC1